MGRETNFDLQGSHVLPALIRKFHEAKQAGHAQVTVWGSEHLEGSSYMSTTWRMPPSS